ncbi:MAG: Smr/MutS family protein, partial [Desulfuromonadales bacterium]|nr:Smr/MutS family protein [Desulfuromonadales bacterium]
MTKKIKKKAENLNNPFSLLKGLSVFALQEKKQPENKPLEIPPAVPSPASEDEPELFEQAMGMLGVRQTVQDDILEKSLPLPVVFEPTVEPQLPVTEGQQSAGTRRQARKLVQRIGSPEACLDLHGVIATEVTRKVEYFLENSLFHGCRCVRIITGKGAHSTDGPVLRPLVETYLSG